MNISLYPEVTPRRCVPLGTIFFLIDFLLKEGWRLTVYALSEGTSIFHFRFSFRAFIPRVSILLREVEVRYRLEGYGPPKRKNPPTKVPHRLLSFSFGTTL